MNQDRNPFQCRLAVNAEPLNPGALPENKTPFTLKESTELLRDITSALADLRDLRRGLNGAGSELLPEEIQLKKFAKAWLGVSL